MNKEKIEELCLEIIGNVAILQARYKAQSYDNSEARRILNAVEEVQAVLDTQKEDKTHE